jgi:glutathione synthase/RimK-type ligase-like ATP-grasp enzyme
VRIGLATAHYYAQHTPDDDALIGCVAAQGAHAEKAIWNDPTVDWSAYDGVVVRSTWDYYTQIDAFLAWIDRLQAADTRLFNPPQVLRWNAHKSYLLDLPDTPLPTTVIVPQGHPADLVSLMWENGMEAAVLKLAVSAGAWGAILMGRDRAARHGSDVMQALSLRSDVLVQAYVPAIKRGEVSLVFMAGAFSHAVKKTPAPADYRTQGHHGAQLTPFDPPYSMVRFAEGVLEKAAAHHDLTPADLLYGRVDVVEQEGEPLLMELELLEPSLYLSHAEGASERFARAIIAAL